MSNFLCCWEAICNLYLALPLHLFSLLSLRPDFISGFLKSLFFPSFHMLQKIFRTRLTESLSFSREKDRATGRLFHSVPQVAHPQTPESCAYNDPSINLPIQNLLSRVHATKKKSFHTWSLSLDDLIEKREVRISMRRQENRPNRCFFLQTW